MVSLTQVQSRFDNNIQQSLEICQFVERGQAQTPLEDLFRKYQADFSRNDFSVTLLCLTEDARQSVLKWLYGHKFPVFSLEVPSQIGLMEIDLKDRGYSLEKSTGERQEFDDWEQLLSTFTKGDMADEEGEPADIRLGTETRTEVKKLHVLMPESARFIQDSPALLTKLLRETNVLMVAAPPQHNLSDVERQVLDDLLDEMTGFWPLLPVDELSEDSSIPANGWWQRGHAELNLPPTLLTTHVEAALPDFLTDVDAPLRQALYLLQLSKKVYSASEAVNDRYEQEISQLNSRKKREQRKSKGTGSGVADNGDWSRLRNDVGDTLSGIGREMQNNNRKRELPTATGVVDLKQHIDSLTGDDLAREDGYKTIKLSLGDAYVKDLMRFLEVTLKQSMKDDLSRVVSGAEAANKQAVDGLERIMGYRPNLPTAALDQSAIWQELREIIGVELRYQGEMPKRGFFDRLSEGRKSAFVILMSASLLAYMGIDVRDSGLLGLLILPVFIGSIFYTYKSWKKEDAARMDKEITRVREEVLQTAKRLISDVSRQKQVLVNDYLDGLKKAWLQQLETFSRDWQNKTREEGQQQTAKADARIQAINTQITEWQNYRARIQSLLRANEQLCSDAEVCVKGLVAEA